jgi:predicted nucleotidyltransferase
LTTKPVEGYFIVTDDNLVFEVKGIIHPEDRVIAYLRYVPDSAGDRLSSTGTGYRKVYELLDRTEYLKKNHPEYLWFDNVHNRILQAVPNDKISYILSPIDKLGSLRDQGEHLSSLQTASIDFARKLVEHSGIQWDCIGITGSQLAGFDIDKSDIDLVVYGIQCGSKVYSILKNNPELIPEMEGYSGEKLDSLVSFRWGVSSRWWKTLRKIESKKVLQGLFQSNDFFIRIVRKSEEQEHTYGDTRYEDRGRVTVRCTVVDDSDSIFTPCFYKVSSDEIPELLVLTSYRGRFTEHVHSGMSVEAEGKLELVERIGSPGFHFQLVLGENPDDYLIPV